MESHYTSSETDRFEDKYEAELMVIIIMNHDHTSGNLPFKKQKCDDDSTDVQNAHDGHATSLPSTTLDNAPSHSQSHYTHEVL